MQFFHHFPYIILLEKWFMGLVGGRGQRARGWPSLSWRVQTQCVCFYYWKINANKEAGYLDPSALIFWLELGCADRLRYYFRGALPSGNPHAGALWIILQWANLLCCMLKIRMENLMCFAWLMTTSSNLHSMHSQVLSLISAISQCKIIGQK